MKRKSIRMTVRELKEILEKAIKDGHGDAEINVVSSSNCETISEYYNKWTSDIEPYFDTIDGTFTISD